jgi:malonate transporter
LEIADSILPVFAVVITGWILGATAYLPRGLSDALIHLAYNVAMPALLLVTIAQEPAHALINWVPGLLRRRLMLCFALVFGILRMRVATDWPVRRCTAWPRR